MLTRIMCSHNDHDSCVFVLVVEALMALISFPVTRFSTFVVVIIVYAICRIKKRKKERDKKKLGKRHSVFVCKIIRRNISSSCYKYKKNSFCDKLISRRNRRQWIKTTPFVCKRCDETSRVETTENSIVYVRCSEFPYLYRMVCAASSPRTCSCYLSVTKTSNDVKREVPRSCIANRSRSQIVTNYSPWWTYTIHNFLVSVSLPTRTDTVLSSCILLQLFYYSFLTRWIHRISSERIKIYLWSAAEFAPWKALRWKIGRNLPSSGKSQAKTATSEDSPISFIHFWLLLCICSQWDTKY